MSKKIPNLTIINAVESSDLFLVNKPGEGSNGYDRAITKNNLVRSMGNPAVVGFNAIVGNDGTEITLTPANQTSIDKYYNGMLVGFKLPAGLDNDAFWQIRILNLPLKSFNPLNANKQAGEYCFALYDDASNAFNEAVLQITNSNYTSDYIAEGTVEDDEQSTTYALTAVGGDPKTALANGMSFNFTVDIASQGAVFLAVDGLDPLPLIDSEDDEIPNPLKAFDRIAAVYAQAANKFIKNRFDQSAPEADALPQEAYVMEEVDVIDEENGDIIVVEEEVLVEANVPDVNKVEVTVGTGGQFQTIAAAINGLRNDFGVNGGNMLATITLQNTFVWTEQLRLTGNLSWITINAPAQVNIAVTGTGGYVAQSSTQQPPFFSGYFVCNTVATSTRKYIFGGAFEFINFNMNINTDISFWDNSGSNPNVNDNVNMENSSVDGGSYVIYSTRRVNFNTKDCTFSNQTKGFARISGTIYTVANSVAINMINSDINCGNNSEYILDVRGRYVNPSAAGAVAIISDEFVVNLNGCNITSAVAPIRIAAARVNFVNCTIKRPAGTIGINVGGSSRVLLNGGNYRSIANVDATNDVLATSYSQVTIKNDALCGTSTSSNGEIINE